MDKKWICPKCGNENTAYLPLVKKATSYKLFREGTQEYNSYSVFSPSTIYPNVEPLHPVYRHLNAPVFKEEPENVNLDPGGLRRLQIWRIIDKIGLCAIFVALVYIIVYIYRNSFFDAIFYIVAFIGVVIGLGVVRLFLDAIYSAYLENRSNICLDCGHIYQPPKEG